MSEPGRTAEVRRLVALLDSQYPIVRMRASEALRRVSGKEHGFRHGAPFAERARAARRWWAWWALSRERLAQGLPLQQAF